MGWRWLDTLLSLILLSLSFSGLSRPAQAAPTKMEFWRVQRKGANNFNVHPDAEVFQAAKALGIEWVRLAYDKWPAQERDFLLGNADHFTQLQSQDLTRLKAVLDMAQAAEIKVVIAPLSLPGVRWVQNNGDQPDLRLWNNKRYWGEAAQFWKSLAAVLKDHPAVVGYNLINEPTPERGTGVAEHGDPRRYGDWYKQYAHTSHDLPAFYQEVIAAIRTVDKDTPIMLDAGWYAQPNAFVYWPVLKDPYLLYAFHMYEPYAFTNRQNFKLPQAYRYPGEVPFSGFAQAETQEDPLVHWNRDTLHTYLTPFLSWASRQGLSPHQIVASEFGCYRRNPGCAEYLSDLITLWNQHHFHWAFYSFREDEWDGYDYEVGTGPLPASYWEARDRGELVAPPRQPNPLFDVLRRALKP